MFTTKEAKRPLHYLVRNRLELFETIPCKFVEGSDGCSGPAPDTTITYWACIGHDWDCMMCRMLARQWKAADGRERKLLRHRWRRWRRQADKRLWSNIQILSYLDAKNDILIPKYVGVRALRGFAASWVFWLAVRGFWAKKNTKEFRGSDTQWTKWVDTKQYNLPLVPPLTA